MEKTKQIPTVCMCVYQRPHNLPEILEKLDNQSFDKNFQVFIWNNTAYDNWKLREIYFPSVNLNVQVFGDGINHGSQARFWLPTMDEKANPIIFMDDDQIPYENFVEYMFIEYLRRSNSVQGWKVRTFPHESYWNNSNFGDYGKEVDYIGTGGMVLDRDIFNDQRITNIPKKFEKVEDLWLCYIAKEFYSKSLIKIKRKLEKRKDNQDQHKIYKLKTPKEECFDDLRTRGWKLVREM